MNTIELTLKSLGFSYVQIHIYIALTKKGLMRISDIVNNTKHHRPAIYNALLGLLEKGLVIEVLEGKGKKYKVSSPLKLYDLMDKIENDLDVAISELSEHYNQNESSVFVQHLKGKSGLSHAFLDVVDTLKRGGHFYRYSSAKDQEKVNMYVPHNYRKKRDAKNLTRDVITNRRAGNQKKLRPERTLKFIDTDAMEFRQNIVQFIYGNKISLLDFNTENAYILENKEMADFQKSIFKALFNKL